MLTKIKVKLEFESKLKIKKIYSKLCLDNSRLKSIMDLN